MKTFSEKGQVTVTAHPRDRNGALFIPSNARYRIDDLVSRNALVAWTSLTAAKSMTITIPASVNAIIDSTKKFETKVVTVEVDHGTSSARPDEIFYRVKNLQFVS